MELKASEQTRPLIGLTCGELLTRLKGIDPNGSLNTELHREFCLRFEKFLYKCCRIGCSNHEARMDIADDIFQESIVKALKKVHLFKYNPLESEKVIVKRVTGWLGIIANNSLIDFLRNNCKEVGIEEDEIEEIVDEVSLDSFDENSHIAISFERLRLQEALATLSDRDKYIVMVYANYGCLNLPQSANSTNETEGKIKERHLSDEAIARLCEQFKISKGNLRAIKNRAIKKILEYLSIAS